MLYGNYSAQTNQIMTTTCVILDAKRQYNPINTSYLTDSYIDFTLKMESVPRNTIFGLKMMTKSGLEKFILNSLHAGRWLFLLWRDLKKNLCGVCTYDI